MVIFFALYGQNPLRTLSKELFFSMLRPGIALFCANREEYARFWLRHRWKLRGNRPFFCESQPRRPHADAGAALAGPGPGAYLFRHRAQHRKHRQSCNNAQRATSGPGNEPCAGADPGGNAQPVADPGRRLHGPAGDGAPPQIPLPGRRPALSRSGLHGPDAGKPLSSPQLRRRNHCRAPPRGSGRPGGPLPQHQSRPEIRQRQRGPAAGSNLFHGAHRQVAAKPGVLCAAFFHAHLRRGGQFSGHSDSFAGSQGPARHHVAVFLARRTHQRRRGNPCAQPLFRPGRLDALPVRKPGRGFRRKPLELRRGTGRFSRRFRPPPSISTTGPW